MYSKPAFFPQGCSDQVPTTREYRVTLDYRQVLLLCLAVLLAYGNVVNAGFVADDFTLLGRLLQEGWFATAGQQPGGFLRPFSFAAFWLDLQVWGLSATPFRVMNLLLHAVNASLLLAVLQALLRGTGISSFNGIALAGALMFALLPSHTESVTWISGRPDLLVALFTLMSLYGLFQTSWQPRARVVLALVCYAAGLLSKENAVLLPLCWCVLLWAFPQQQITRRMQIVLMAGALLMALGWLLLRKALLGEFIGGYGSERHLAIFTIDILQKVPVLLWRTVLPALPPEWQLLWPDYAVWAASAALAVAGIFMVLLARTTYSQAKLMLAFAMCYGLMLLPGMALQVSLFDIGGERVLYVPGLFACAIFVWSGAVLLSRPHLAMVFLLVLSLGNGMLLHRINTRWMLASELAAALAREAAQYNPASTVILNMPDNLRGAYVFRHGLPEAATLFLGRPLHYHYAVIGYQDMLSPRETPQVVRQGSRLQIRLRPPAVFRHVNAHGARYQLDNAASDGASLHVDLASIPPEKTVLLFQGTVMRPMLREVKRTRR